MIRYVEGGALGEELMRLTASEGAAACRIGSLFLSYAGYDDIARFWVGLSGEEEYCIVSLYGGCATVYVREGSDLAELREFLCMLSPEYIASESIIFPETKKSSFAVMLLAPPYMPPKHTAKVLCGYCDIPCKEIYSLLRRCRCEDIDPPPYDEFVSVLTGFQRRNVPFCSYIEKDGSIVAFAMTQAVTYTSAIIGSVCVFPEMRGNGLGSSVVLSLAAALGDRDILVICDRERNGRFYEKLCGAYECGVWSVELGVRS